MDDQAVDGLADDSGRVWSPRVLLQLVHIWRHVELAHPTLGRVAKAQRVYDAFSEHGGSKRSRKAVEDKLYAMKQMYRFIVDVDRSAQHRESSSSNNASARSWFELTKEERRKVRSRYGVRIPSISQEVFLVFDSVLQREAPSIAPAAPSTVESQLQHTHTVTSGSSERTTPSQHPTVGGDHSASETSLSSSHDNSSSSGGNRNWTPYATAALATAWEAIQRAHPRLRGAALSEQVHRTLETCADGLPARSRKAVEEKMHAMKEMHQFIQRHDDRVRDAVASGSSCDARTWFELSTAERRHLRKTHRVRAANLSRGQFEQMQAIMGVRAAAAEVSPVTGVVASDALSAPSLITPVPSEPHQASQSSMRDASTASAMQRVITQTLRVAALDEQACCHCDDMPASATSATTRDRVRKRTRVNDHLTRVAAATTESTTASLLLEQMRTLHEEDRAERQRQHAELLAALRELTALVRAPQR